MKKQESSYRWVVFGSVLFAYFLIVSQRTAPGLITDQLMWEFQVSGAVIGLISSVQFFAYAGLQIPSGLLSDRFGPNHFLIIGTFLAGVGTVLYSISTYEYMLMVARLIVGVGDATIFINLVLILTQWFMGREFIKLLGFVSLTASVGSLVATVPFSMWISVTGWRAHFITIGIMLIALSAILYFILVVKPRGKFQEDERKDPKKRENVSSILHRTFTSRQAWATFMCHFGVVGAYVGFIGSWGVPFGIHVFDMSRAEASGLMMVGLVGAMIGGPLISYITSRLQAIKKIYSIIHLTVFISWVGMFFLGVNSYVAVVILLFIIGFGNGASSLTFAVVRESFPVEEVGVVTGFANTGGFLSAVLLPIIFGKVLDVFSQDSFLVGYHYGFMIPVLFSLIGLVGVSMIKEKRSVHS